MDQTCNENIKSIMSRCREIYRRGCEDRKIVALTFDDAPDAYCTPKILDILKRLNVPASFAVIGTHIEENKSLLKRIYKENHLIINHTYSHTDLSVLSYEDLYDEIIKNENLVHDLIGVKPSIVRPPYGELSLDIAREIVRLNYSILLWSYDTRDWMAQKAADILDDMFDSVKPGEIILLHSYENKEPTVEALEPLILGLRERGYEFVTIKNLLGIECYQ